MTGRWKIRTLLAAVAVIALALGTARLIWRAGLFRRAAEELGERERAARLLVKCYREEVVLRRGLALSEASEKERAWNAEVASVCGYYVRECSRRAAQLAMRRAEYERAASRPWLSPRDPGDDWDEPSRWPESFVAPTLPSEWPESLAAPTLPSDPRSAP